MEVPIKDLIHTDHNQVKVFAWDTEEEKLGHYYSVEISEDREPVELHFQNGAVALNGVNGLTSEALLSVLLHRTQVLNELFPCQENEVAIENIRAALNAFEARTRDRLARGVEGKNLA